MVVLIWKQTIASAFTGSTHSSGVQAGIHSINSSQKWTTDPSIERWTT